MYLAGPKTNERCRKNLKMLRKYFITFTYKIRHIFTSEKGKGTRQ